MNGSRWRVLGFLTFAACAGGPALKAKPPSGIVARPVPPVVHPLLAYVSGADGSLSLCDVDAVTGSLAWRERFPAGKNTWLGTLDGARQRLYVVNLTSNDVVAFAIDPRSGRLTNRSRQPVGRAPAHLSLDGTGRYLLVANYTEGTVSVLPVADDDGALGAPSAYPVGLKPHAVVVDPSNRFVFVTNLGSDTISQFTFDASVGALTPNVAAEVSLAAGTGPRHMVFDRQGWTLYVANEINSTVSVFQLEPRSGTLTLVETVSSVPPDFAGKNTGSDVQIAPSGRFVYASNRGHDSLAIFAVDGGTGRLTPVGHRASSGRSPQTFAIDPSGRLMLVANRGSNSVAAFDVDLETGMLRLLSVTAAGASPLWIGFPKITDGL